MPPMEPRTRQRLTRLAVLVAPVAIVQGARVFEAGGPMAAPGAVATPAASPITEPTKAEPISEAQRRALAHVAVHVPRMGAGSPMDRPDPQPEAAAQPTQAEPQSPTAEPEFDPLEGVRVTAIIGADGREESATALIGRQIRRVGDEIAPGWRIRQIDPRHRRVVVAHADGRERELAPPSPSPPGN